MGDETRADFGYFTSLTIENVRCFSPAQTLMLRGDDGAPAKWTVVLGNNGVGKTTLLQCLVAMEPVALELSDRATPGTSVRGMQWMGAFPGPDARPAFEAFGRRSGLEPVISAELTVGAPMSQSNPVIRNRGKWRKEYFVGNQGGPLGFHLLLCAYGASRKPGAPSFAGTDNARTATLFDESAMLLSADEWLLRSDYAAKSADPVDRRAAQRFERVRRTLIDLLEDVSDLRVAGLDTEPPSPRVEARTPYGWVALRDLSLGYRTMMAWVVDLAARMFARYPDSDNPLAEPAICLVDEIDLHLHPRWQQQLISYLDERFPRTQFIVTAHSPLVVQAARDANIAVLERRDVDDFVTIDNAPESVRGWRVDQILNSDLFGLGGSRSPEVNEMMCKRARILGQPELSEGDRAELALLEERLSQLPEGEIPEDQDAWDVVRQFAATIRRGNGAGK